MQADLRPWAHVKLLPGGSRQILGFCQCSPIWLGRGQSPGWGAKRPDCPRACCRPPGCLPASDHQFVFPHVPHRSFDGLIPRESGSLWPRLGRVGIPESGLGTGSAPPLTSCVTVGMSLAFRSTGFPSVKYWLTAATRSSVVGLGDVVRKRLAHSRYFVSSNNYYKCFC